MNEVRSGYVAGGILDELSRDPSASADSLMREVALVIEHPVYRLLTTVPSVVRFMELQVWCVWDFMFLAKAVQRAVGCYEVPWVPPRDCSLVATINAIVGSEEADMGPDGTYQSHFEIYVAAMRQAGADTGPVGRAVELVREGVSTDEALRRAGAPDASRAFVGETLELCVAAAHVRVAALCIGREELVPQMFTAMLSSGVSEDPRLGAFLWYVRRHVNLDSESHGPLSAKLFRRVVGLGRGQLQEAVEGGLRAVRARRRYLDAIHDVIQSSSPALRKVGT